jgi:hypothetical protein
MPAVDDSYRVPSSDTSPGKHAQNVTPNDNNDLVYISRALYLGAAGNVNVTLMDGTTIVLNLGTGWHPLRVTRVLATSTTATGIIAVA